MLPRLYEITAISLDALSPLFNTSFLYYIRSFKKKQKVGISALESV